MLCDLRIWADDVLDVGSVLGKTACDVEAMDTAGADGAGFPTTGPRVVKPPMGPSKVGAAVT